MTHVRGHHSVLFLPRVKSLRDSRHSSLMCWSPDEKMNYASCCWRRYAYCVWHIPKECYREYLEWNWNVSSPETILRTQGHCCHSSAWPELLHFAGGAQWTSHKENLGLHATPVPCRARTSWDAPHVESTPYEYTLAKDTLDRDTILWMYTITIISNDCMGTPQPIWNP